MEGIGMLMLFLYAAFIIITVGIVIYLIVKRVKNKGKEGFEERDN